MLGHANNPGHRGRRAGAVSALLSLLALGCAGAGAATLTFDGNICEPAGSSVCTPGIDIGSSYGSILGQLDVVFSSRSAPQNGTIVNSHVHFWDSGFGDLTNVAYAALSGGGETQVGEVALRPKPGFQVSLNGFDFAGWMSDRTSQVTIYDSAFNVLSSTGSITVSGTVHSHFAPGITRSDAIIIQWGPDSFNAGIDNIDFSVSAVPEPSIFMMLMSGFGLVLLRLHSRRRG